MHGIQRDHERFKQIVRGKIKQNLRKYMSQGGIDIFDKNRHQKITVPIPRIDLPKFKFGSQGPKVGQGEGPGSGGKDAGNQPGENEIEVNVSLEEMADLLSEELQLPRIEPKGSSDISVDSKKYSSLRRVGPESLRHRKKTYFEALKRSIASGEYDPRNPKIIPIKDDRRYRDSKPIKLPRYRAVVFYMMDVSGSMGEGEKERARLTSFWIDLWLRKHYDFIQARYITHHFDAREVDRHTFYHVREGGGTRIASAYELMQEIIKTEYDPSEWNIYGFQYSDGDDWGGSTSSACNVLADILPSLNQMAYCQVSPRGDFCAQLESRFGSDERVVITQAHTKDDILDAIKAFFCAGN